MHKKPESYLYKTFKKNERMDFCIDFSGGVLYIYDIHKALSARTV